VLNGYYDYFWDSGTMTVAGTTTVAATNVQVNAPTLSLYADNTFAATNFDIWSGPTAYRAVAKDNLGRRGTNTVTLAAIQNYAIFSYDENGNMLSDGIFDPGLSRNFDYDDENQLTRVTVTNVFKSEFNYDGKMRRRVRREYLLRTFLTSYFWPKWVVWIRTRGRTGVVSCGQITTLWS